jgi:hypothetical protein
MRPQRPALSPVARPGIRAVLGVLTGISIPLIALSTPIPPGSEFFWVLAGIAALTLGVLLDHRARTRRTVGQLAAHAYEACPRDLLDPDVAAAARSMRPWPLPDRARRVLLAGEHRERTVWIALYSVRIGKSHKHMSLIAVQTARAWAPAIIRRKRFLDQLHDGSDLDHPAFDAQREMRSDHPEAAAALAPLADWFVTNDTVRRRFRLHEIPGKAEQWAFRGNWALLASYGHATAEDLLQLADYLTAFAEAADELNDPRLPEVPPS